MQQEVFEKIIVVLLIFVTKVGCNKTTEFCVLFHLFFIFYSSAMATPLALTLEQAKGIRKILLLL
jgi:hypothetical protein